LFQVKARLKKMGSAAPLHIFLRQELDRMQRVVTMLRVTLSDLLLAIDGSIIMSDRLRECLDNMYARPWLNSDTIHSFTPNL